ncbi:MAG: hypothetical protein ACRCYR_08950 [Phycicoccus sp.]
MGRGVVFVGRGVGGVVLGGLGALVRVGVGSGVRDGVLVLRRGDGVADGVEVGTGLDFVMVVDPGDALWVVSAAGGLVCAARAPTTRGLVTARAAISTATAAVANTTRGHGVPLRGAA